MTLACLIAIGWLFYLLWIGLTCHHHSSHPFTCTQHFVTSSSLNAMQLLALIKYSPHLHRGLIVVGRMIFHHCLQSDGSPQSIVLLWCLSVQLGHSSACHGTFVANIQSKTESTSPYNHFQDGFWMGHALLPQTTPAQHGGLPRVMQWWCDSAESLHQVY